jgi:hypothetical protein
VGRPRRHRLTGAPGLHAGNVQSDAALVQDSGGTP